MTFNAEKTGGDAFQVPALETLIDVIDRQVDLVPHPYATDGFAVSAGKDDEKQKKKRRQYLRFYLNETTFALPLKNALQIDYLPEITPLPNLPRWLQGVCNLHGQIYSVVELKQVLRLAQENAMPVRKLVLMKSKDIQTAVLVDRISGTLNVDVHKLKKEVSMSLHPSCARFIRSVVDTGTRTIHLLDVDELVAAMAV
ncbi:MAG: chemotaxis protein CheW [Desulfobacteraceae bacterium]|jgi:purine-binding chemotaxis protein CheW